MKHESPPVKINLEHVTVGELGLEDLIRMAMKEKELPRGFGDHLRYVSLFASQVHPAREESSPSQSSLKAHSTKNLG